MRKANAYSVITFSIIILVITIFISLYRDAQNRRYEGERFLFPKLSTATDESSLKLLNDIAEIKIASFNSNFTIKRDEENWYLPNLAKYPVPLDKIKKLIVGVAQLETIEPKTKNPNLHGELGLNNIDNENNSANYVSLINTENKEIAAILVGNDSKFGIETRYVRKPSENQTWLVWRNFDVPKNQIDWLDESLFKIERWRVADVEIIHPNNQKLLIKRENYAEQYFKIQNLDEDTLPMNPYVGNQIGSVLEKLSLLDIRPRTEINFTNKATKVIYTSFDGLKISIITELINGVNWSTFDISYDPKLRRELPKDGPINVGLPDMLNIEEVKNDALKLNMKVNKWAFSFKNSVHQKFNTKIEDITKKRDIDKKE